MPPLSNPFNGRALETQSYFHFANLPKVRFKIQSGSHFLSQYESIISIYKLVKALSTLMTLFESISYLICPFRTQILTENAITLLNPNLNVQYRPKTGMTEIGGTY